MTHTASSATATRTGTTLRGGGLVGDSPARPDGRPKVTGEFAYSSDLWLDGMLWGATLRSPLPRAWITRLDITGALALPGVAAVLTHQDVPGQKTYGLEHKDQPVLAVGQVRYQGEPVALVAADHPETARRAVARITAEYSGLPPLTDARAALAPDAPPLHEGGDLVRDLRIRRGSAEAHADAVSGTRSRSRMSASPRASTTTRSPGCGSNWPEANPRLRCTPPPRRSARAW